MSAFRVGKQVTRKWSVTDLSAFYVEHRSHLVARANRSLRDSHRAEEVAQDALLKFILAAPELENSDHALAYLFKTVDNLCLDIFRQEGRRPNLVVLDSVTGEGEASLRDNRDHSEIIAEADDAAIVRQALSLLSPAERAALVMWEIEGRSTEEIAKELGIKESTVRHTVSRARVSLRKILSEYVIDEERGLTALDLLSNSYRKVSKLAKDGSRVALSFIVLLFAYLGFTNFSHSTSTMTSISTKNLSAKVTQSVESPSLGVKSNSKSSAPQGVASASSINSKTSIVKVLNAKALPLSFPGLDKNGVPTGFSVTDSSGKLGQLYFNGKEAVFGEDGVTLSSVSKTSSGAANILLTQSIYQDANGVTFDALVSFGRQGAWVPLNTKLVSLDMERLASGNYMLTAVIQVKSEVDSTFVIPAFAAGRDLEVSPARVVTRVLLNSSKTQVVGQAVLVVERASN